MRELWPTHTTSRGDGPVRVLARPRNAEQVRLMIDEIRFNGLDGKECTVKDYLRDFHADAFLAMKITKEANP